MTVILISTIVLTLIFVLFGYQGNILDVFTVSLLACSTISIFGFWKSNSNNKVSDRKPRKSIESNTKKIDINKLKSINSETNLKQNDSTSAKNINKIVLENTNSVSTEDIHIDIKTGLNSLKQITNTKNGISPIHGKDTTGINNSDDFSKKVSLPNSNHIDIKTAFTYKGAIIQYKVKVENPTSEPIGDINVNIYVPDVFVLPKSINNIPLIKPTESKTVTFDIRPTGECGDCQVSGKVIYYDYKTKETTEAAIPPRNISIVCPMLRSKEITESEWRNTLTGLTKAEETTKDIDMPASTLFDIVSDVLQDMNLFMLDHKVNNNSDKLYRAVSKFYGEGIKSLKYASQIEVVGGSSKSKLILKAWTESEDALTGFYHGILDEIEKRIHVKSFIDTAVVNNYHYGDNIGTQITDSVVQRSFNQNDGNYKDPVLQDSSYIKIDEQKRYYSDNTTNKAPNSNDFTNELFSELRNAETEGKSYLDVRSGDLHRIVGGYPQPYNRMPICCNVMRQMMNEDDEILEQPPKGNGANLVIRYHLPHNKGKTSNNSY